MVSFNLNQWVARRQRRTLIFVILGMVALVLGCVLLVPKHTVAKKDKSSLNLTGIVDDSFSEINTENAMTSQQAELESLKNQIKELKRVVDKREENQAKILSKLITQSVQSQASHSTLTKNINDSKTATDTTLPWQGTRPLKPQQSMHLHSVSFVYGTHKVHKASHHLSPEHYVPSGTFVRAVILGGADADASVNGQSKNNGVMLFKLLQPGTLPNGQHSYLQGCFVTASSYGDISSERAYVILDKLSCAQKGKPIIDKQVSGWAFFGGKVGIKGVPLMRDNKVMQWAGISGAMSGIAAAAQYSQSVQSISALGSATSVPSGNIAPYAAYGGASKAAEVLSNYYVKRAEQYHPVIQVGSGNLVTIVFKDGFYLDPDEKMMTKNNRAFYSGNARLEQRARADNEPDFDVPQEVLNKISPVSNRGDES